MSKTVNAKLYKIQDSIVQENDDNKALIKEIVNAYSEKTGNEFSEIELSENVIIDKWNSSLFVYTTENKPPYWQEFLSSIVSNQDDLENIQIQYSSFVLFVYDNETIFVISKGYYGHFLIEEHIDTFFGMEVLSRLVNKSSTEIKQIEERGLFGSELGAQRFFRENHNLAFEDDFGKIYKAMLASIEENDFKKLGITQKKISTKKLSITGGSSLEISSNFTYKELVNRIIKIKALLQIDGVEFNQFYRLPSSELRTIKENLINALLEYAFECYQNGNPIDFYSPNIFNYLRSIETQFYNNEGVCDNIKFCSSVSYNEIMASLVEKGLINDETQKTFIDSLKRTYGQYTATEGGIYSTGVSLDSWFCGEVDFNGKKYFKLDGAWYLYRNSLDEHLNLFFQEFAFEDFAPANALKSWTEKNEGLYNESFKNKNGFIVGDRAYLNLIEMADIIEITDDKLYLHHVKKGLGQDTRSLISQINNAARYLTYFKDEENNAGLKSYYKSISNKHYNGNEITLNQKGTIINVSEENFIQLFKTKKIVFVFVYCSDSLLSIKEEIIATNSRIAKLALVYIIRDIARTGFELLFERIRTV